MTPRCRNDLDARSAGKSKLLELSKLHVHTVHKVRADVEDAIVHVGSWAQYRLRLFARIYVDHYY